MSFQSIPHPPPRKDIVAPTTELAKCHLSTGYVTDDCRASLMDCKWLDRLSKARTSLVPVAAIASLVQWRAMFGETQSQQCGTAGGSCGLCSLKGLRL